MFQAMKDYWWLILIRGIVAVIFGIFVLFDNPVITAVSLVLSFGAYAVVNGGITLAIGIFGRGNSDVRIMLAVQGVLQGALGILVLVWHQRDLAAVPIILFAFVGGIIEIVAAFQNRDFWLGLSGIISVLFGVYAFRFPGDGALAVVFAIGIYAISVGVMQIIGSFQVRNIGKTLSASAA